MSEAYENDSLFFDPQDWPGIKDPRGLAVYLASDGETGVPATHSDAQHYWGIAISQIYHDDRITVKTEGFIIDALVSQQIPVNSPVQIDPATGKLMPAGAGTEIGFSRLGAEAGGRARYRILRGAPAVGPVGTTSVFTENSDGSRLIQNGAGSSLLLSNVLEDVVIAPAAGGGEQATFSYRGGPDKTLNVPGVKAVPTAGIYNPATKKIEIARDEGAAPIEIDVTPLTVDISLSGATFDTSTLVLSVDDDDAAEAPFQVNLNAIRVVGSFTYDAATSKITYNDGSPSAVNQEFIVDAATSPDGSRSFRATNNELVLTSDKIVMPNATSFNLHTVTPASQLLAFGASGELERVSPAALQTEPSRIVDNAASPGAYVDTKINTGRVDVKGQLRFEDVGSFPLPSAGNQAAFAVVFNAAGDALRAPISVGGSAAPLSTRAAPSANIAAINTLGLDPLKQSFEAYGDTSAGDFVATGLLPSINGVKDLDTLTIKGSEIYNGVGPAGRIVFVEDGLEYKVQQLTLVFKAGHVAGGAWRIP